MNKREQNVRGISRVMGHSAVLTSLSTRAKPDDEKKSRDIRGIQRVLLGLSARKKFEKTRKNKIVAGITRVLRWRNAVVVVYL